MRGTLHEPYWWRAAHAVHELRHRRRGRAAELARATRAGEPHRGAVAKLTKTSGLTVLLFRAAILRAAKLACLLPIIQLHNIIRYTRTRESRLAQIAALLIFMALLAFTTSLWLTAWTVAMWVVWLRIRAVLLAFSP
jgi:hypothetical protein